MVTIRLSRGGSKKRPFYHLTVTDHRMHVMVASLSVLVFLTQWRKDKLNGCVLTLSE